METAGNKKISVFALQSIPLMLNFNLCSQYCRPVIFEYKLFNTFQ